MNRNKICYQQIGLTAVQILIMFIYETGIAGGISNLKPHISIIFFAIAAVLFICFSYVKVKIHHLAFFCILMIGLLFVYYQPIFNTLDEPAHFARAELLSRGNFFLDRQLGQETANYKTIAAFQDLLNYENCTAEEMDIRYNPINMEEMNVTNVQTIHMSFFYIPQAAGIITAKSLDLGIIWLLWLGRFWNLLFYSFFSSLAIKIADKYKFFLFFAAVLPFNITQAASFSPDTSVYAVSLVMAGYFIHLYCGEAKLNKKNYFMIAAICVFLIFSKFTNVLLAGIFLLLPSEKYKNKRSRLKMCVVLTAAAAVCAVFAAVDAFMYAQPIEYLNYYSENGVDSLGQIQYIFSHLGRWIINFVSHAAVGLHDQFLMLYRFGYQRPFFVPLTAPIIMIEIMRIARREPVFFEKRIDKIWTILFSVGTFFSCQLALYVSWTKVGAEYISGMHPRYLFPAFLTAFLVLADGKREKAVNTDISRKYFFDFCCIMFMQAGTFFSCVYAFY